MSPSSHYAKSNCEVASVENTSGTQPDPVISMRTDKSMNYIDSSFSKITLNANSTHGNYHIQSQIATSENSAYSNVVPHANTRQMSEFHDSSMSTAMINSGNMPFSSNNVTTVVSSNVMPMTSHVIPHNG